MQQHLITDVYLLGFLLLVGWALARSLWKWKRTKSRAPLIHKTTPMKLLRLAVTGLVAFAILLAFRDKTGDYAWLVWLVLWVALYWLWKLWDRWRGKGVDKAAPALPAQIEPPSEPPAAPERDKARPPRRRMILRRAAVTITGALVVIVLMLVVMLLGLAYYQRQAKKERDKVRVGMTVEQVLPLVHGALGVRAHAILPDNVTDKELKHYVSFGSHEDMYCCFEGPDGEKHKLTAPEAAAAMHQKMSDGYEWIWRYTFVNDTPMHFSFSVTFGTDGRVKQVTDVWGWD
jgi:hypothetical protein